jgi:hypothetical protein
MGCYLDRHMTQREPRRVGDRRTDHAGALVSRCVVTITSVTYTSRGASTAHAHADGPSEDAFRLGAGNVRFADIPLSGCEPLSGTG